MADEAERGRASWLRVAAAVLLAAMLGANLGGYHLWDPDEAKHAEIAREMSATKSWFRPSINCEPYSHKPPFFYALVAGAYHLFGVGEAGARVVPATAAWLAGMTAVFLAPPRVGFTAAVFLAASPLFVFVGRFTNLDALVTACLMLSVAAACRLAAAPQRARWAYLFHVASALAVLVKGPVAWALVIPPLALAVWRGDLSRASLRLGVGILLQGAIVSAGALPAALEAPRYLHEFIWVHNVQRFLAAPDEDLFHPKPMWFFVPILLATTLPWGLLVPPALAAGWRGRADTRLLTSYPIWVFLFFSLSSGKLATYVLPAYPALAVLVARYAATAEGDWPCVSARIGAGLCALLPIGAFAYLSLEAPALRGFALMLIPAACTGLWLGLRRASRGVLRMLVGASTGVAMSLFLVVTIATPSLTHYVSDADLAHVALQQHPDATTVAFRVRPFSYVFYTQRCVVYPAPVERARAALYRGGSVLVLTEPPWEFLLEQIAPGVELHELARNPRHVLFEVRGPMKRGRNGRLPSAGPLLR